MNRVPDYPTQGLDDTWAIQAAPIVRQVVSRRLGRSSPDVDDVCAHAMLQLAGRLRNEAWEEFQTSVLGVAYYFSAVANPACDHYLRTRYPLRWRLRNRIRYALEHDGSFALGKSTDGTWLCGLAGSLERPRGTPPAAGQLMSGDPRRPQQLLHQMFALSGGPLELTAVVDLAASVWGVPLLPQEPLDEVAGVADERPAADVTLDQRREAERLWEHIRELPGRQRQALLLNLRYDAMWLFIATGIASIRAIAEAVEMTASALAELWNDLPLPDNEIAARLGCTRQQVINLRMAARKRLGNRLFGRS